MSRSLPAFLAGAVLGAAAVTVAVLAPDDPPADGASDPSARVQPPAPVDPVPAIGADPVAAPDAPALPEAPTGTCPLTAEGVALDVRPDLGLADPAHAVVPIYRTYVPARLSALMCPGRADCALPEGPPVSLWTSFRDRPWRRAALEPAWTPRGRCWEARWEARAELLWPDTPEGVAHWALVVGEVEGASPSAWREAGRPVWTADVVYAGEDGSPEVH